jgi:ABC-2 type transport system ATP-binding protein
LLHVSNLTKRYGRVTALAEVSFSIRSGEILGLIGPNGSGKTTLFECLAGVLPADGGTLLNDDRPVLPRERATTLFYLPDAIAPWPAQTVRWALAFVAGYFGRPNPANANDDVVRRLDLEPLLDSSIGALSKGQRKRALLAIGLLAPQPILLADEPFDGLDLRQTRDVARTLREHAAAGRTIVLSIHQIADAARVCDRFVLLSGGRVRGEGTLDELTALAAARDRSPRRAPAPPERDAFGRAPSANLEEIFLALT